MSELKAKSVGPEQMPHSVVSNLALHCLPMSLLWDARLKWVNPLMPCGVFYLMIWTTPFLFFKAMSGRNGYVQHSKGSNSKSRQTELRFMCSAL